MKRGQVSVELLIVLAFVLVISVVSVVLLRGSVSSKKEVTLIVNCQTAAKQCDFIHRVNKTYDCDFCEEQCVDSVSGEEIFPGAVNCCKLGNDSAVFIGSSGC